MVKDKRIELRGKVFVAIVEFFQDNPSRYGDSAIVERFPTLIEAQEFLGAFPRDVWDGYEVADLPWG